MKYVVTSALPYVNNIPHLGNLICIISADVHQRFLKNQGKDVLSILGTDEHGTTTERIAIEEGKNPKEVVDHYREIHKDSYDWFNCDFDCFGRTSSQTNHDVTQKIFERLDENGYIKEKEVEQLYDETAETFLSDRFVEGECPECGFSEARGDQCDECGSLLDPLDLIDPVSKISGEKPTVKSTKHLFLRLDKLQPQIEEHFENVKDAFTDNARSTTQAWFDEGLEERAITRDLDWGISVPKEGFEDKVFYVWFDAPIGYISITKENREDWETYWKEPDDTKLIQFMGKDNILFHSVIFPGSLIGTRDTWKKIDVLDANEYLNYEDKQFSKSRNVGVFADNAKESGIHPDIWRYYLMSKRPEKQDTTFTWEDFQEKVNADLVNNYGNLINRTTTMIQNQVDGRLGSFDEKPYSEHVQKIIALYEEREMKKGLKETLQLSSQANTYLQKKKPWKVDDLDEKRTILTTMMNWIKDVTILLNHIMPEKTKQIRDELGLDISLTHDGLDEAVEQQKITKPDTVIEKLSDEKISELKDQYGAEKPRCSNLDLRVGKIENVREHDNADKLYLIDVDIGSETRQIVSGLVPYYEKKNLKGEKIVLLANLEEATIRGERSEGMLLAVEQGDDVGILIPDGEIGQQLRFEGYEPEKEEISFDEFQEIDIKAEDETITSDGYVLHPDGTIIVDKGLQGNVS